MATAKKKLAPSLKKTTATKPNLPSKRPYLKVETAGDAPRLKKGVEKLAKKREWKIQVISSQTIGTSASSVSAPTPTVQVSMGVQQNLPTNQEPEVHPILQIMVEMVVAPLVEGPAAPQADLVAAVLEKVATMAERNPPPNPKKKSMIILEEEVRSFLLIIFLSFNWISK